MPKFLYLFCLLLIYLGVGCTTTHETEKKLIENKWKQVATIINGQQITDERFEGNIVYAFMPEGKCEIIFPKGPVQTTYQLKSAEVLEIVTGSSVEEFLIQKLEPKRLELIDSKGTIFAFQPLM